jgi:ABC-type phosphate transport system substrate-binding protein
MGGGATFPHPIYARWIAECQRLHPDTEIQYDAIGSGESCTFQLYWAQTYQSTTFLEWLQS